MPKCPSRTVRLFRKARGRGEGTRAKSCIRWQISAASRVVANLGRGRVREGEVEVNPIQSRRVGQDDHRISSGIDQKHVYIFRKCVIDIQKFHGHGRRVADVGHIDLGGIGNRGALSGIEIVALFEKVSKEACNRRQRRNRSGMASLDLPFEPENVFGR